MNLLKRLGALALGLISCVALAQHATTSIAPAGYAPEVVSVTVPASSTPQQGTVTSSAATATSGTATFASGKATIGPLTPQLGRDIRVLLKGTWAGTFQVFTSPDGCTTLNPLTVGGQPWGSYTGNANEVVDTPSLGAVYNGAALVEAQPGYCATATITSGTLTYSVRQ